ncbi:MAG TPA: Gfo/Idh/MocA family oxidoreductase, partial [Kribbella sp.]|nr:Gfo/Idh/MocA family oxidoreductase [Kribbella sp.]
MSTDARKPRKRLRVGIVGGGFMGQVHGRAALVSGATVVGAVGSSPARAEAAAGATGAERGFATVDELLAADVDVVH